MGGGGNALPLVARPLAFDCVLVVFISNRFIDPAAFERFQAGPADRYWRCSMRQNKVPKCAGYCARSFEVHAFLQSHKATRTSFPESRFRTMCPSTPVRPPLRRS